MSLERTSAGPEEAIAVRPCRPADRGALERLGHPPPVARLLAPSLPRRVAWRLTGTRALALLAEDAGATVGSVQFLRSRRDPGTWMFGHWRVAAARRRQGIGRLLLEEGVRRLPEAGRLYSYVECDNEASLAAHGRLGFETGGTLRGSAPLGTLSTLGPATPAVRLEPIGGRDWPGLFAIYARAMGSLWLRLFPGVGPRNFLGGAKGGLRAGAVALARGRVPLGVRAGAVRPAASGSGPPVGFVVWEGASVTLFAEPAACDAALLARVALQILALGARRDLEIDLRGLPRSLAERAGPLVLQALMGMPDVRAQWRR